MLIPNKILGCLLLALLCGSACAQVMNDWSAEAQAVNTRWWQQRVSEGFVRIPRGRLYINGTAYTKPVVGCLRIEAEGARSYPVHGHPTLTGNVSSIYQMGNGPILVCCGNGVYAPDPLELVNEGQRGAAIEVEGRNGEAPGVATGGHYFANISFDNWDVGFRALGGYYVDGKLVASEGHADTTTVERCTFTRVASVFKSENQQALDWMFRDCAIGCGDDGDCVLADIVRGGWVTVDHVSINHPRVTIFRLRDYSPNQSSYVCRDFRYDAPTAANARLTLIEETDTSSAKKRDRAFEITGAAPRTMAQLPDLYRVPADIPRQRWTVKLTTLPEAKR